MNVTRRAIIAGAAASAAAPSAVLGQAAWPTTAVKMTVPFSAGSATDILARAVAQRLAAKWGQSVVVENRPGIPGAQAIAKGPADGTLMLTSNGHAAINAINRNLDFDAVKDFAPIAKVASAPSILIVPANSPARTLADLVALAKSTPGGLQYASAGVASSTGIAGEYFRTLVGAPMQMGAASWPYRNRTRACCAAIRRLASPSSRVGGDLIRAGQLTRARRHRIQAHRAAARCSDLRRSRHAGLRL